MNYFAGLSSVAEIKTRYRELARTHHPDLGGCLETMKAINAQYHQCLQAGHGQEQDGRKYTYRSEREQEIMDKISDLLRLPELQIDLIGLWVWIRGNTKPHKEALKEAGCCWHRGRGCWYWKPSGLGRSSANPGSLEELALKYGAQGFKSNGPQRLATA